VFIFLSSVLFSFEWPQDDVVLQSVYSGFAQLRDSLAAGPSMMSQSLIFAQTARVKVSDKGVIAAIIREPDSDSTRFCSTLGNAVIVNHGDNLVSVYGNLDTVSVFADTVEVDTLSVIGFSGSSGWQQGESGLEFQIIDIQNRKAINPRILMPRFESESRLSIPQVIAVNKQGETFLLGTVRQIASGQYTLYLRGTYAAPYKTMVLVNGAIIETVTYDALNADRTHTGKLTIQGKNYYTAEELYPDLDREDTPGAKTMYVSTIVLSRGRNTIRVTLSDINNVETQVSFTVDVY
jgi:hypothetical protein